MKFLTGARICSLYAIGLSWWVGASATVLAQVRPETFLPPEIERSLVEDSSPNFFQQGIARFEQEIQRLTENKQADREAILQVRQNARYPDVPNDSEPRNEGEMMNNEW